MCGSEFTFLFTYKQSDRRFVSKCEQIKPYLASDLYDSRAQPSWKAPRHSGKSGMREIPPRPPRTQHRCCRAALTPSFAHCSGEELTQYLGIWRAIRGKKCLPSTTLVQRTRQHFGKLTVSIQKTEHQKRSRESAELSNTLAFTALWVCSLLVTGRNQPIPTMRVRRNTHYSIWAIYISEYIRFLDPFW